MTPCAAPEAKGAKLCGQIRKVFAEAERARDAGLSARADLWIKKDLSYGQDPVWHLLDLYRPRTEGVLPLILCIHGGAYVYGSKDSCRFYGMELAAGGFAVACINYRLAPEAPYPAALTDVDRACRWLIGQANTLGLDAGRLFLAGDSVGAQLALQYAVLSVNSAYRGRLEGWIRRETLCTAGQTEPLFPAPLPTICGLSLNGGNYDFGHMLDIREPLAPIYFGTLPAAEIRSQNPLRWLTDRLPPARVTAAEDDFMKEAALGLHAAIQSAGGVSELQIYRGEQGSALGHVFQLDIRRPEAQRCNAALRAFFLKCGASNNS